MMNVLLVFGIGGLNDLLGEKVRSLMLVGCSLFQNSMNVGLKTF